MCHAGLVNNSLVTDYDIGVLPSEHQDYLKSMVGVQHDKTKIAKRVKSGFLMIVPIYAKVS
jgi:hypothetical protein